MLLPIVVAIFLGAWGLPPLAVSPTPSPAPSVNAQEQQQLSGRKTGNGQNIEPNPEPSQIVNEDASGEDQSGEDSKESSPDWITRFTAVIAGAAVLQLIVFIFQAYYMRRGLTLTQEAADAANKASRTAEEALRITERADILIDHADSDTPHNFTKDTILQITMKNFGRTRAIEVMSRAALSAVDQEFSDKSLGKFCPPIVLSAGANLNLSCKASEDMSQVEIDAVAAGTKTASFYVEVNYSDVFAEHHYYRVAADFNLPHNTFRVRKVESD